MGQAKSTEIKIPRWIIVITILSLLFSIIAIILFGYQFYYHTNVFPTSVANIAAVPGQTDVTGNLKVLGELHLSSWQDAISSTEASFTTKGGISALGSIVTELGIKAKSFDTPGLGTVMKIGTENQVGMDIGREDFPINVKGNKLFIDCPYTLTKHHVPQESQQFNLGTHNAQWHDLHLSGNIVNKNGFITKSDSNGVFTHLTQGPKLIGSCMELCSLLPSECLGPSNTLRTLQLDTIQPGDMFKIELYGSLDVGDYDKDRRIPLQFSFDEYVIQCDIQLDTFETKGDFSLIFLLHFGKNNVLTILSEFFYQNFVSKNITEYILNNNKKYFSWDVSVIRNEFSPTDSIQSKICFMSKVY
jgi:hypothetical protein